MVKLFFEEWRLRKKISKNVTQNSLFIFPLFNQCSIQHNYMMKIYTLAIHLSKK